MSTSAQARRAPRRWVLLAVVAAGIGALVGANVHLVWVAIQSQPECVAHLRLPDGGTVYRAAKSAC